MQQLSGARLDVLAAAAAPAPLAGRDEREVIPATPRITPSPVPPGGPLELPSEENEGPAAKFFEQIFYGTRVLLREPSLRQAIVASFAEATAGAAAIVATVAYAENVLRLSESVAASLMAVVGVGSAITAIYVGQRSLRWERLAKSPDQLHRARHRWGRMLLSIGGVVLTLSLLPGLLLPPVWLFALLWLANGVGQALIAIPSGMLLAEHTTDKERGRVYATHFALTHAFWLFTYPAIGYSAAFLGIPVTFTLAGGLCCLTTFVAYQQCPEVPRRAA